MCFNLSLKLARLETFFFNNTWNLHFYQPCRSNDVDWLCGVWIMIYKSHINWFFKSLFIRWRSHTFNISCNNTRMVDLEVIKAEQLTYMWIYIFKKFLLKEFAIYSINQKVVHERKWFFWMPTLKRVI